MPFRLLVVLQLMRIVEEDEGWGGLPPGITSHLYKEVDFLNRSSLSFIIYYLTYLYSIFHQWHPSSIRALSQIYRYQIVWPL